MITSMGVPESSFPLISKRPPVPLSESAAFPLPTGFPRPPTSIRCEDERDFTARENRSGLPSLGRQNVRFRRLIAPRPEPVCWTNHSAAGTLWMAAVGLWRTAGTGRVISLAVDFGGDTHDGATLRVRGADSRSEQKDRW